MDAAHDAASGAILVGGGGTGGERRVWSWHTARAAPACTGHSRLPQFEGVVLASCVHCACGVTRGGTPRFWGGCPCGGGGGGGKTPERVAVWSWWRVVSRCLATAPWGVRRCALHHRHCPHPPGTDIVPPSPSVTFRLVVAPLRGPGRSPVLPFACCVRSGLKSRRNLLPKHIMRPIKSISGMC